MPAFAAGDAGPLVELGIADVEPEAEDGINVFTVEVLKDAESFSLPLAVLSNYRNHRYEAPSCLHQK